MAKHRTGRSAHHLSRAWMYYHTLLASSSLLSTSIREAAAFGTGRTSTTNPLLRPAPNAVAIPRDRSARRRRRRLDDVAFPPPASPLFMSSDEFSEQNASGTVVERPPDEEARGVGTEPDGDADGDVIVDDPPPSSSPLDSPPSSSSAPKWMKCINAVVPRNVRALNEAVSAVADVTLVEANALIEIGAVWARMDTLSEEDIMDQYYGGNAGSATRYADLPAGWGGGNTGASAGEDAKEETLDEYVERQSSLRYRRITSPSTVEPGMDIRVYPRPRRFPSCYEFSDPDRLLYEDTTFVVVDKPPMLPVQPEPSNYEECCPGCTDMMYGPFQTITGEDVQRPLICHRVDSCVGGCVVMSKDGNGQKVFSDLQRQRKIKKVYLAVTKEPVALGMHVHWMWAPLNARGQTGGTPCQFVSHTPPESRKKAKAWIRCVLEVVKCEPITISDKGNHGYDPGNVQHYQNTIRLVTGRKHQVRAQLASMGCPIIRDTLYEPISGMTLDGLMDEDSEEAMDEAVSKLRVPKEPIGLQAHAILFAGVRAKARTPWWGDGRETWES